MENVLLASTLWLGLARVASAVSIVSVALIEIVAGTRSVKHFWLSTGVGIVRFFASHLGVLGYASLIGPGLGSTTDRPVEVAPCSVLVVK